MIVYSPAKDSNKVEINKHHPVSINHNLIHSFRHHSFKKVAESQLKMINAFSMHISAKDEIKLKKGHLSRNKLEIQPQRITKEMNHSSELKEIDTSVYEVTSNSGLSSPHSKSKTPVIRWVKSKQEMIGSGSRNKSLIGIFNTNNESYRKSKFDDEFNKRYYQNEENEAFEDLDDEDAEVLPKNSELGYLHWIGKDYSNVYFEGY